VLSTAELAVIWRACDGNDAYGAIVRLLILTGQRREEIGGLRFDEVCGYDVITLPASRTKNRRAHLIPLSAPAQAILAGWPAPAGDFVFRNGRPFVSWSLNRHKLDASLTAAGTRLRLGPGFCTMFAAASQPAWPSLTSRRISSRRS
jgi:integrase